MNRDRATEIINNCFRDIIKHQIKEHVEAIKGRLPEAEHPRALEVYHDTIRECYGTIGLEVLEEVQSETTT
jgi:hypothetical protein